MKFKLIYPKWKKLEGQTTFNLPFGGTRLLWSPDGTDLLAVVSWGDGRGEATYGLVIRHP